MKIDTSEKERGKAYDEIFWREHGKFRVELDYPGDECLYESDPFLCPASCKRKQMT
jgi:hypothetical protein